MSSTDERIVQMQFDNRLFEKNVETSRNTIKELKNDLNFDGAVKSLGNLEKAGRNFTLEAIGKGVDGLNNKFTALGIAGITVIQNLTNSMLNMSKRFMSSLTVDPIKTGLAEYETKMGAITTILTNTQSKGTTLTEVNDALAELNDYADLTIYNFAEMTRNIGTFTAAGVGLKDSTEAIKGIANLAAGSGSNAQQASTAMYQLSQALASGKVQLMDWNSVVNAGMGGEMFKQGLIDSAKALGIATPAMKDFRDSLKDGWITSEVLLNTLQKFAKDESLLHAAQDVKTFTQLLSTMKESVQSGWAVSWEHIFGDKDSATNLFTSLNNAFSKVSGASADARNAMLEFWNANGGRNALIEGIAYAFMNLSNVMRPIEEAFRNIFPPMTGEKLVKISEAFRDLMKGLKMGEATSNNLKRTFQGLFALLDIGGKAFMFIAKCIGLVVKALMPGAGGLLSVTGGIGDFLISINESIEKSNFFGKALQKVGGWVTTASTNISNAVSFMSGKFEEAYSALQPVITSVKTTLGSWTTAWKDAITHTTIFSDALTTIKDVFGIVADKLVSIVDMMTGTTTAFAATTDGIQQTATKVEKAKGAFDGLHKILSKVWDVIKEIAKVVKSVLSPVFEHLKKMTEDMTMGDIGALLTGGGFFLFAKTINSTLGSVNDILDGFSGILDQVGNSLKAFQLQVKANALLKVAIAMGVLAASIALLSIIDGAALGKSLGAISVAFIELIAGLVVMNKMIKDVRKISGQLLALGAAMLLLATSVKIVSSIDSAQLLQGTVAIMTLMASVAAFIKLTNGGDLAASSSGIIGFAIGITILSGALSILGNLKMEALKQGAIAIAGLMTTIAAFIKLTNGGDLAASAGGLMGFAIGITILAGALTILGKINPETLQQGAIGIGGLMTVIAAFINLTNAGDLATSAGGLIAFSIGITILSGALSFLGKLDFASLLQGGIALSALMVTISNFIKLTNAGDLAASSAGIIGFAVGLTILTGAVAILAKLDFPKLLQGSIALSAIMLAISNFVRLTKAGDLAASSAGIIGFAVGITILAGAVAIISMLNANKVVQSFTVIAGLMTVLGLFIKMTSTGDLVASSAGIMGFAKGILVLAGAIAILSALNQGKLMMATTAISALILVMGVFINLSRGNGLAKGVLGMVGFAAGIVILSAALIPLAQLDTVKLLAAAAAITILMLGFGVFTKLLNPAGLIASGAGLLVMAGAIVVLSTALSMLGSMNFTSLLVGFAALAGTFVILGAASLILGPLTPVLLALAAAIAIIGVGALAVGTGLKNFATGLSVIAAGGEPFKQAIIGMINLIPQLAVKIAAGIVAFAVAIKNGIPQIMATAYTIAAGLIKVFTDLIPKMAQAAVKMVLAILTTLAKYAKPIVDAGLKLLIGLLQGISNNIQKVTEVAVSIIIRFLKGITNKLPAIIKTGVDLIVAFIKGIGQETPRLIQAGFQMIISFINGLADTIREEAPLLAEAMVNLGDAIIDGLISALFAGTKKVWESIRGVGQSIMDGFKDLLGIHSPSTVFSEFGGHIVQGLINGVKDKVSNAIASVKDLGNSILDKAREVLGIHSPSTMFNEIGTNLIAGLTNGITENKDKAVNASEDMSNEVTKASSDTVEKSNAAAKSAYDKAVEWIDERKYYNKLSLEQELAKWKEVQAKYAQGSDERKKIDRELYRVRNEIRDRDFAAEKKAIEDRKYYGKETLEEELADWQAIQKKYKKGTEERIEADREVYRLKKELRAENFAEEKEAIEDKIFYDKESTEQEIKDYEKLQKKYRKGSEEREEIDRHLYELRKRLRDEDYTAEKKAIEDAKYYDQLTLAEELAAWQAIQAKYGEGSAEREEADREVYRVHKEITQQLTDLDNDYYANQKAINDKMAEDIQALTDAYDQALEDRAKALYNTYGLFDKVETPEFVSGQELIYNLEAQNRAMEEWATGIQNLANKGVDSELISELQSLGPESLAQIQALNTLSDPELQKYVELWKTKHEQAKTLAINELTALKTETETKIEEIKTQTQTKLDELKTVWETTTAEIKGVVTPKLKELKTTFETQTSAIITNTKNAFTNANWNSVGVNIVAGMVSGINSSAASLASTAASVAKQALNAAKNALGIHSPSKEFAKLGMYADQGFALGLTNFAGAVTSSAGDIGTSAIDSLGSAIANISDFVTSNMDTAPTIRPVLDLSNIKSGTQLMGNLLDSQQGISITGTGNLAARAWASFLNGAVPETQNQNGTNQPISFTQNNYSPKALSRIELYRQTKNQLSTLKGLVSTT